ncbi:hypothetical protein K431DRAFT_94063 [Polychaeton citri CBS 116435]|uniref:Uncharacterized protein n=1 Tax=Polychaeton citri CBS 116435 TaxID=1314669 RepID=A0A9P4UPP9_9PEZI|nr:hypothetical protein K431DRAFT_94063 [Polychaeton citri CBS 116435]
MPRIKLFVNLMPPRPVEVPSTQSPQKPSNCEVRFAVTASERWQIGDLWKHIKVEHSKAYGKDTRARWVKLQGTEGEDLPNHERVGDMWNVHMGKADRHVFVVRDMFDRETSLAPDSTLLPPVGTPSAFGSDREVPRSARSSSLFQRRIQAVRDTPTRESDSERGSLAESVGEDQEQPTHAVVEVEEDAELMVDEDNFKIPRLPRRLKDAKEAELQLQRESQQSQQSQQSQLSSSPFAPSSYHRSPLVNDVVIRDSQGKCYSSNFHLY